MAFAIPRNTATAVERRIPFVLVDATDKETPEDITVTGVKVALSFGGAADVNSTNDIVKVDGPLGMYYIELTQTEADKAPGPVHGHVQPSGCARTYIEAQIGAGDMLTAAPTTTQIRDAILNWAPYTGYNLARLLRAMGIVLRGTASGLGTTSATFTAPAGGATVTATVDANGNRTVVADTASGTP
jgi:hypothetical protein